MSKLIIIGIHGLGNKPPRRLLERWWKRAVREGLDNIGSRRAAIPFVMVHWADILYERSLKPWIWDEEHPLYLDEPYRVGEKKPVEQPRKIRTRRQGHHQNGSVEALLGDYQRAGPVLHARAKTTI